MAQNPIRLDDNGNPIGATATPAAGVRLDDNGNPIPLKPATNTLPAPPNMLGKIQGGLDNVASTIERFQPNNGAAPLADSLITGLAAAPIRAIAHPVDNAPMLGAIGAGLVTDGAGWVPLAASTAGSLVGSGVQALYDHETGRPLPSFKQVAGDVGMNAIIPEAIGGLSTLVGKGMHSFGNIQAAGAIKPDAEVLAKLINPATGKRFETPGEAAKYFKESVLDVGAGRPGSVDYAKDIRGKVTAARGEKEAALTAAKGTQIPTTVIPANFQDVLQRAASSPDPAAALKQIDETLSQYLVRQEEVPNSTKANSGLPAFRSVRPASVDVTDADKLIRGLDASLSKSYTNNAKVSQMGGRPGPDFDTDAMKQIRANLADALEKAVPGVKGPNAQMAATIPFEQAATAATAPTWSGPGVRASMSSSGIPKLSAFDYLRNLGSYTAQPTRNFGDLITAVSGQFPNIARALTMTVGNYGGKKK